MADSGSHDWLATPLGRTVLELECDADPGAAARARKLLEHHGGTVAWMTAVRAHGGRECINLRVRMPPGHSPEILLEEAGFTVVSCLMLPTAETTI